MSDNTGITEELRSRRQWMLFDTDNNSPRRPGGWTGHSIDWGASWKEPTDWLTFEEACEAAATKESYGIGFVFREAGDWIPIDVDGCLTADGDLKDWVPSLDSFAGATYIEYSPSGDGLHIYVEHPELPPWWTNQHFTDEEHEGIEAYDGRFFTVTGDQHPESTDSIEAVNPDGFLWNCYTNITGETPDVSSHDTDSNGGSSSTGEDIDVSCYDILRKSKYPPGERCAHPYHGSGTGANFHVNDDGETFRCWRSSHSATGNGLHLLGMDEGIINCGDWVNGGLSSDTWCDIFDAARERGLDVPEREQTRQQPSATADGGVSAASPPGSNTEDTTPDDGLPTWEEIRSLFGARSSAKTDEARYETVRRCEETMSFIAGEENEQLRVYDDERGFYRTNAVPRVRGYLSDDDRLRHAYKRKRGNATANVLIDRNSEPIEAFGGPIDKLCLGDCVLDISDPANPEREDHTPAYWFTAGHPVEFDPDAECPRWMEFIGDAVEPSDIEKFQEYMGYCLLHDRQPFKKAAFLVGPTDSGKGTALRVLSAILGDENIANETLYDLMNTRWGAHSLFGRGVNIRNEVSPGGVGNVQKFKELVGGEDDINAEDKGTPKYEFTVTQKFVFATNRFPNVEHADEAFYNRLLFISFPNRVPDSRKDPELAEKLIKEASGILNWMLDGLARLLDNGEFTGARDQETKESLVDELGGPIDRFVHACLELTGDDDDLVHKGDLHDLMLTYATRSGMDERPQQAAFTRAMKTNEGVDDDKQRLTPGGESVRVFTGVRVESKAITALDVDVRWRTSDGESGDDHQGSL